MAVRLEFEGIRCFYEPQSAPIRPITLLVGENSSGKSTFLALCRIAYTIAGNSLKALPFNEPPFLLGAYDQIASYRGGRSGRAKSFSITVSVGSDADQASVHTEFVSRGGQPAVRVVRLTAGEYLLQATRPGRTAEHPVVIRSPLHKTPLGLSVDFDDVDELPLALWVTATAAASGFPGDYEVILRALKSLRSAFPGRPYAFAPIRTNPLRTYDPVSPDPKPEGSHVPMLMAALSRSVTKRDWVALQSALNEFGSGSGLFEGIEIVNKGKKASDPFQVGVKTGGPAFTPT